MGIRSFLEVTDISACEYLRRVNAERKRCAAVVTFGCQLSYRH